MRLPWNCPGEAPPPQAEPPPKPIPWPEKKHSFKHQFRLKTLFTSTSISTPKTAHLLTASSSATVASSIAATSTTASEPSVLSPTVFSTFWCCLTNLHCHTLERKHLCTAGAFKYQLLQHTLIECSLPRRLWAT